MMVATGHAHILLQAASIEDMAHRADTQALQDWFVSRGADPNNRPPESASANGATLRAAARYIMALEDVLEVAVDFVAKVDRGEARSKRSYAMFVNAIAKASEERAKG